MAFTIVSSDRAGIWRITGDKGNLIGLVTMTGPDRYRVELLMKIDNECLTFDKAVAFVRGAEAALRAFKVLPKSAGDDNAMEVGDRG